MPLRNQNLRRFTSRQLLEWGALTISRVSSIQSPNTPQMVCDGRRDEAKTNRLLNFTQLE